MESPHYRTDVPTVCVLHNFEAVSIHGGGHLQISLPADRGRFQPASFNVDAECCLVCGEIRLRVPHPSALRRVVEAREEQKAKP